MSKLGKDDEARARILARRKFFIASALAGVSLTACDREPQVCLNVAQPPPAATAGPSATPSATTQSAAPTSSADVPPRPRVCLEIAAPPTAPTSSADVPPRPRVCLRIVAPPRSAPTPSASTSEHAPKPWLQRPAVRPQPSPRVCLSEVQLDPDEDEG